MDTAQKEQVAKKVGRPAYALKSEHSQIARTWVENQIHKDKMAFGPFEAIREFESLHWNDFDGFKKWCDQFLKEQHWKRLKNAIRAAGSRKKARRSNIDITYNALFELQDMAADWDCSLSEAILKAAEILRESGKLNKFSVIAEKKKTRQNSNSKMKL